MKLEPDSFWSINGHIRSRVVDLVTTDDAEAYVTWLSNEEVQQWENRALRRNKLGWLASRIAAKRVIMDLHRSAEAAEGGMSPNQISIHNSASGKPYIVTPRYTSPPNISLSHKFNLGMATVGLDSTTLVGCDIEFVTSFPSNTTGYFFSKAEEMAWTEQLFPNFDYDELYTLVWSIKESCVKSLPLYFRKSSSEIYPYEIISLPLNMRGNRGKFTYSVEKFRGLGVWMIVNSLVITACFTDERMGGCLS